MIAYVGPVVVVRIEEWVPPSSVDRYMDEFVRGIDIRRPDTRAAALYDVPTWTGATSMRRRQWARLLAEREDVLRRTTKAWALRTESPLVRGMLKAIHWIQPPPYPHAVVGTHREAFEFIHRYMPEVDPGTYTERYHELLRKNADRLRHG
ncbi:MAG: hypothetical protein U0230_11100 [Polyangiales bacterium]